MTEYYCYDAPDGHHKTCIRNTAKKIVLQRIPARGVTLTIGVFFDGTGNNVENTNLRLEKCKPERYGLEAHELATFSEKCMTKRGYSDTAATSYLGYYTNIHWLNVLYKKDLIVPEHVTEAQRAIYIEGIGTEKNEKDSTFGLVLGKYGTGVITKTDRAVELIKKEILDFVAKNDMIYLVLVGERQRQGILQIESMMKTLRLLRRLRPVCLAIHSMENLLE